MWSLCTKSVSYIKYPKACQQGESGRLPRSRFLAAVWGLSDPVTTGNFKQAHVALMACQFTASLFLCLHPLPQLLKHIPDLLLFHLCVPPHISRTPL